MKKILLLAILVIATIQAANRPAIDEYGRDVKGHDNESIYKKYKGHIQERHVKKSQEYLRARCASLSESNKVGQHMTSYKNILDAQETLTRITNNRTNRRAIDTFERKKTRTNKALFGKLYTGIQRKYYSSYWSYIIVKSIDAIKVPGKHGYGYGYNCQKSSSRPLTPCISKKWMHRMGCVINNAFIGFSGYKATYTNATGVIKYNIHKNRWFYLTSHPR